MVRQNAHKYAEFFSVENMDSFTEETLSYRAFPHTLFPVVLESQGQRVCKLMNYSLVPPWSETRKPKFATYNARIETLCEKPTWREPIKSRRCLVGITSFFESCYEGSHAGHIVEFKNPNDELWAVAGLWSEWIDKSTGEVLDSFAIITTEPSPFIRKVGHDRSPVFLNENGFKDWLKPNATSCAEAVTFLKDHSIPLMASELLIERELKPGWDKKK